MSNLEVVGEHKCFGGIQGFYRHPSVSCKCEMGFSVYSPPQGASARVPILYYLAGLTCTEETIAIKSGAQRLAADLGLMLVCPDTSPRGANIPGEGDDWELGLGAGFYVDATEAPWSKHYRMYSYVTAELPEIVSEHFPADPERQGVFGHSMGGHGALVCAFRNPERYRSVSAFAPIGAPIRSAWGTKAFENYLGPDRANWSAYDASELVRNRPLDHTILIDQGMADQFLDEQLRPDLFEEACRAAGQAFTLRRQEGYDHSYYFVSTFMADHLRHHAAYLIGG